MVRLPRLRLTRPLEEQASFSNAARALRLFHRDAFISRLQRHGGFSNWRAEPGSLVLRFQSSEIPYSHMVESHFNSLRTALTHPDIARKLARRRKPLNVSYKMDRGREHVVTITGFKEDVAEKLRDAVE